MSIQNISNFFNSFSYDKTKGEVTFTSVDGTNVKTIKLYEPVKISDTIDAKPSIYEDLSSNNAVNGSYAILELEKKIYYRENNDWKLIYRNSGENKFLIDYYSNGLSYEKDYVVGFEFKKYKSLEDNNTTIPEDYQFDFVNATKDAVDTNELKNILHIDSIGRTLYVSSTSGLYSVDNGKVNTVLNNNRYNNKIVKCGEYYATIKDNILQIFTEYEHVALVEFDTNIADISSNGYYFYVATISQNTNTIYEVQQTGESFIEILNVPKIDGLIMNVSETNICLYNSVSNNINIISIINVISNSFNTYTGSSNIIAGDYGIAYALESNDVVVSWRYSTTKWEEITVNDMFKRKYCPNQNVFLGYNYNGIDMNINKYIDSYNDNVESFCFISNMYLASVNAGTVFLTDISNGIIAPVFVSKKIFNDMHDKNSIEYFGGNIIVSDDKNIYVLDTNLNLIEIVDMSSRLEGMKISSMSVRGDTLYVLTSVGKIYMFKDINAVPYDIVILELSTYRTQICVLDGDRILASNVESGMFDIREFDSVTGNQISLTNINSNDRELALALLYDDLYSIERDANGMLKKYIKETR